MKKSPYQLLIFDWDGTLVDSQAHIIECMRSAIIDADYEPPKDSVIKNVIGLSLERASQVLMPHCNDAEITFISELYREHFFSTGPESSSFFDGALDVIQDCLDAGFYLAVATGKSKRGLDLALKTFNLESYFHITRCADETASKPNPLMLQEILTDLDLHCEQALMIGDTSYDMDMAASAKMDSMAVTYGVHDEETLKQSNPKYLLHDIKQLLTVLNNSI
ncbi:MAG: HAD-IA family hydrolase [Gammaproteobacteria bacterium]|nr:HAD-IA family hydrolase [Gammaproteobacteria bacterium]